MTRAHRIEPPTIGMLLVLPAAVGLVLATGCRQRLPDQRHDAGVDASGPVCDPDSGAPDVVRPELPRPLGDLTGPWQLFVDDHLVAQRTGLTRILHPAEKHPANPVMSATEPWEDAYVYVYGRVMPAEAGAGFRMWYSVLDFGDPTGASRVLYAESPDGLAWNKPALGIRSWNGDTDNNFFIPRDRPNHILSVMHTPWDPDPGCAYKLINFDGGYLGLPAGYNAACSADGVHLTDLAQNPVIDTATVGVGDVGQFLRDPWGRRYLGYVKVAGDVAGYRRRLVALTTTQDFAAWPTTPPEIVLQPDAIDDRWATDAALDLATNRTHFYGLSVFPYESQFLGFLWIFRASDPPSCGHDCEPYTGYIFGTIHVELVSSRDGLTFTRTEPDATGLRPAILPLGPAGAWDSMMIFTANHPLRLGDELRIYYGGCDEDHGRVGTNGSAAVGLATLRKDGFVSLDAQTAPGTLVTPLLAGIAGQALRLNFRTSVGGTVRVAVLSDNGQVVPGFDEADCDPLEGDAVDRTVTWGSRAALPAPPCLVRLRFTLQDASLFSFAAGDALHLAE